MVDRISIRRTPSQWHHARLDSIANSSSSCHRTNNVVSCTLQWSDFTAVVVVAALAVNDSNCSRTRRLASNLPPNRASPSALNAGAWFLKSSTNRNELKNKEIVRSNQTKSSTHDSRASRSRTWYCTANHFLPSGSWFSSFAFLAYICAFETKTIVA